MFHHWMILLIPKQSNLMNKKAKKLEKLDRKKLIYLLVKLFILIVLMYVYSSTKDLNKKVTINITMKDVLSSGILEELTKAIDEHQAEVMMSKIYFEDRTIIVLNSLLKNKLQEVLDNKPKHRKILIVKRKKETIVLPEDLLEKVDILKMSNLCSSFKGKTMEEFYDHCQSEMHNESLYEIANTLTIEQSKGTVNVFNF